MFKLKKDNKTEVSTDEKLKEKKVKKCKKVKTESVLQMEMVECGAASLAMILGYYKKFVPLEKLREACGVGRDGVKASNIVKAAKKMGLASKGFRKEPNQLRNMKPPMIIHWNFNHFIVLEGFKNNKVYLNDPASGRRTVSFEEFDIAYTGVVLTFEPEKEFVKSGKKSGIFPSLSKRLSSAKSALTFLVIIGIFMVIPGIVIPSYSKIFIDEILLAHRFDWLKPLLWCMLATVIIQAFLEYLQQKYLLRMETKIAMVGASTFFWHILRLPIMFFQQRSAGDISNRMKSNDAVAAFLSRDLATNVINIITLIFYFVIMINYNVILTLISLFLALISMAFFVYSSSKLEKENSKMQQNSGKLYGTSISGLFIIDIKSNSFRISIFF